MKPFFIAAALSLGLCSCSESAPAIQITQIKFPSVTCEVEDDAPAIARGSLNVQYGQSYVLGFLVNNGYQQTAVDVGDIPLEPGEGSGGAATAFVKTLRLSYSSPDVSLPDGEVNYTAGLSPGSQDNVLVANVLTAEAAEELANGLAEGEFTEVTVTVQFAGEYGSGHKNFETNELEYSFTAFKRNLGIATCAPGTLPDPVAPCGSSRGGQENNYPTCVL
ncbi:hypothetical protein D7X55_14435 [Corallococcus sp. AB049A]|uniref:Lipoprotein n=1 Tax=Corallococcus interemptor TaxID=2316720 RepID=A0A3A8PYQ9_9BACT|nr:MULTISPECIES: hypothetical protein [Corallococcus]RKH44151.1 hypothetical protein D7Y23_28105 [Corallococcus sp. AB050B]RKH61636.1 hypothetical protein D7X96_31305 [Corallococcus interemptor]RKI66823.1 hypothetical protein D7X55_14435 [Corallococcus sp. AB049A]